jgi:hypothetical protein
MMKKALVAIALAASFLVASEAKAQSYGTAIPYPGTPGFVTARYAGFTYVAPSMGYLPYSYYAALPFPARDYVGYGTNDFPFYGRPYGSPNDPWTWQSMSRSYYAPRGTFWAPVP